MARHYATRAEARPSAARLKAARRRVLAWLLRRGRIGGTDHEIAEACELMLDTARARRVELRDAGLVRDSGRRRPSPTGKPATVWEAALETAEAEAPAAARRPGGAREPLPIGNTSAEPAPAAPLRAEASARAGRAATRPAPLSARLVALPTTGPDVPASCPRCGSRDVRDTPIHQGRSSRRDCGRCGYMIGFPRWNDQATRGATIGQAPRPPARGGRHPPATCPPTTRDGGGTSGIGVRAARSARARDCARTGRSPPLMVP